MQYLLKLLIFVNVQKLEFAADTRSQILLQNDKQGRQRRTTIAAMQLTSASSTSSLKSGLGLSSATQSVPIRGPVNQSCRSGTREILTDGDFIPADIHGQGGAAVSCDIATRDPRLVTACISQSVGRDSTRDLRDSGTANRFVLERETESVQLQIDAAGNSTDRRVSSCTFAAKARYVCTSRDRIRPRRCLSRSVRTGQRTDAAT
jgi:hypothetical protein